MRRQARAGEEPICQTVCMASPARDEIVVVRFRAPVEGNDPVDGEPLLANRHRLRATWARQDRDETQFMTGDGEIVARWPTYLVERVEWLDNSAASDPTPIVGSIEWRRALQVEHPRAYRPWGEGEDQQLEAEFHQGMSVKEIAAGHQRKAGAICSRLRRLGLR